MAWLRAWGQANEALRWSSFFPIAAAFWPEVRAGNERGLNAVSARVARAVIAGQPAAYLQLAWPATGPP